MRDVVFDTETTGLEVKEGHRVIEIGCVEVVNRRITDNTFHVYINPGRDVEAQAFAVHGLGTDFLKDKPVFKDVARDFLTFIEGADHLVAHNAPFDIGFIDAELKRAGLQVSLEDDYTVFDTLAEAKRRHPGQRNSLDMLCKRYEVDNSNRQLHGALLDSELLARVYLRLTGGQLGMGELISADTRESSGRPVSDILAQAGRRPPVIRANADEQAAHDQRLAAMKESAGRPSVWERLNKQDSAPAEPAPDKDDEKAPTQSASMHEPTAG